LFDNFFYIIMPVRKVIVVGRGGKSNTTEYLAKHSTTAARGGAGRKDEGLPRQA
jgi:hypothetical protein